MTTALQEEATGQTEKQDKLLSVLFETGRRRGDQDDLASSVTMPSRLSVESESYQRRLATFQPLTYFAKPALLSPLVCSRFGWTNPSPDTLVCESCQADLKIVFHPKLKQADVRRIAGVYRQRLCSAHESTCPFWASHFMDVDDSCIVPSFMANVLPEHIVELVEHPAPSRLLGESIAKWTAVLDDDALVYPLDLASDAQSRLSSLVLDDEDDLATQILLACELETTDTHKASALLALFGWAPPEQLPIGASSVSTAQCSVCLAHPTLKSRSTLQNEDDVPPTKQRKTAILDLVSSHRHYCPLICGFPSEHRAGEPMWFTIATNFVRSNIEASGDEEPASAKEQGTVVLTAVRRMLQSGIAGYGGARK